jgi:hypothetical protein
MMRALVVGAPDGRGAHSKLGTAGALPIVSACQVVDGAFNV